MAAVTQVDPSTGEEKFELRLTAESTNLRARQGVSAVPAEALAPEPGPLAATLPSSDSSSMFHLGHSHTAQVVVAFSRPVVDFDASSPSLQVTGAAVASVGPYLVAGEAANAYLVTLAPEGDSGIQFSLVPDLPCASGGVCSADGTVLTEVPAPLALGPPITVEFTASNYTVTEGDSLEVEVILSAVHQGVRAFPVPVQVALATATLADEFNEPPTLTFAPGEQTKSFTLAVFQDDLDDDGEFVQLAFGTLPEGVSTGSNDGATVNIVDDDVPPVTVSFRSEAYEVSEGESVSVVVNLDSNPERRLVIPIFVTNQEGVSPEDYSGVPSTVTFDSGETTKSFTITVTQDGDDDDGESVKLGFGVLPGGVSAGGPDETTVDIADDDHPEVAVSFEQSEYTVAEDSMVTVRVHLSGDPERDVTIPLAVTELGNVTSADYAEIPASLTFASGQTDATFAFSANKDDEYEDGESIRFAFGTLPEGVSPGSISQADVGISDEELPVVTASFEAKSYEVAEGGQISITLALSADPERTVTVPVDVTFLGETSTSDYSLPVSYVTFNAGQTERTLELSALDDREDDDGESLRLQLGALPTGVQGGYAQQTTVLILDNDLTIAFASAAYSAGEGSEVNVEVRLSEAPGSTLVMPIVAQPSGGAGSADYTGVPAHLTFQAGETQKSFTLQATEDTADDDGESLEIQFGTMPVTVRPSGNAATTVSILDDDVPEVQVQFEQLNYSVTEGSFVTVRLLLDAPPGRVVTIPLTVLEGGGATVEDFEAPPPGITFGEGQTETTFTFKALSDDDEDHGESVLLALGRLPVGVSVGWFGTTEVFVHEDTLPQVTVSFDLLVATVQEGGEIAIRLSLSEDAKRIVTIPFTVTNRGGATDNDHSGVLQRVTFLPGERTKTLTIAASRDSDDDGGEWLDLAFGQLPEGVSQGAIGSVTITIRDSS